MGENTKIEWTDHTWNPWVGCTKVSPACDHCYAESWAKRAGKAAGVVWGGERRRTGEDNWDKPVRWNARAEREGRRFKVFCASLADVFDNHVPSEWREDLFELIRKTPHLDWLLLTKRIGNADEMIKAAISDFDIGYAPSFAAWPWPNVWIGATVCNQAEADRDIPKLLRVPAAVRFLSIEPMLGPINLTAIDIDGDREIYPLTGTTECVNEDFEPVPDIPRIDWVICGGESGPHARPMHPGWARSLRDQCAAADVPFLFKQHGEWIGDEDIDSAALPSPQIADPNEYFNECDWGGTSSWRIGKKAAGRLLDGIQHDGFPVTVAGQKGGAL